MEQEKDLLVVKNLKKYFTKSGGLLGNKKSYIKAVDDVSFSIKKGETFGLVGESGCGKSTTGRTIIRLYDVTGGNVIFDGNDISKLSDKEVFPYRKRMQMIFQDPYASLNSRMTVADIVGEPILINNMLSSADRKKRILELLNLVGLRPDHASRYPHEFSGGQRQRIGIARALAVNPEFIICDEPISALDVSIQAQVINLLEELQDKLGLTYLFIAHDLSMVKHISDRIAVMYLGKIVEITTSDELFNNTLHPYTKALLSSVPVPNVDAKNKHEIILEGEIPSALNPPSGCRFRTRCPHAYERCAKEEPALIEITAGHSVACHLFTE